MAGINYAGGLTRSRSKTGKASQRLSPFPIKNGKARSFYRGTPCRVSNGYLEVGQNTSPVVGVAQSFQWIDDGSKQPVWRSYFPSGTSATNGFLEGWQFPVALVDDDPLGTWLIKANTTVAVSSLGALARVQGAGNGNAVTGRSTATCSVGAGVSVTSNAMFRVVGVYRVGEATSSGAVTNDWDATGGTPATIVEVLFCNHLYG